MGAVTGEASWEPTSSGGITSPGRARASPRPAMRGRFEGQADRSGRDGGRSRKVGPGVVIGVDVDYGSLLMVSASEMPSIDERAFSPYATAKEAGRESRCLGRFPS